MKAGEEIDTTETREWYFMRINDGACVSEANEIEWDYNQ